MQQRSPVEVSDLNSFVSDIVNFFSVHKSLGIIFLCGAPIDYMDDARMQRYQYSASTLYYECDAFSNIYPLEVIDFSSTLRHTAIHRLDGASQI